jgi:hypothetical protein
MRIFYLLISIILLMTAPAQSQVKFAVPDPDAKIVRFYPNPAISFINFEVDRDLNKSYSLQIFNFLGKKVFESNVNSKTIVDLSNFVRGLYIFQLREQDGRIAESGKFQVNKY